ncbi:hypothetical protein ACK280_26375 [Mycobacterium sherrisii]|uniref:hypothetical protein n=1 Tax=Mycobacterium sherrisii TaxID=243061 RepID=UPI0039760622
MTTTTGPVSDVPLPAGASTDDCWSVLDATGEECRPVQWSWREAGGIGVAVDGWQYVSGEVTRRGVSVYGADTPTLTSRAARELAAALIEAADTLDELR